MINFMPSFYLMGKIHKQIKKGCPYCELQVAVACKTCPGCKHSFHNAKQMALNQSINYSHILDNGSRRRTERIKREKPNYYDASEFERKSAKKRLERSRLNNNPDRYRPQLQSLKKKKKKKLNKPIRDEEEEHPVTLTSDKIMQCSIILAELNRKMSTTTWRR